MFNLKKILILILVTNTVFIYADSIEEIVVTGSLIKDQSNTILPAEIITEDEYKNYNITSVAEISKYLNISSGSHFQTNALDGVDQGMNSLTLRGLNHASTLVLINSKRHTQAGTPSNQGEGYTDINIIPEIALRKIEILNEANSYTEEVRRSIKEKYGFKKLYSEGLSIRTPLDINYQIQAINSLRKGSSYTAMTEKYEDITWQDENTTIPTQKECEDEIKRLEEEDKKTQYQRDRETSYPSIQEQLDMQYWDRKNGTNKWEESIDKVKADNPKPS